MNVWLVSYQEEVRGTSHEYHALLKGENDAMAYAACERMGEFWWLPCADSSQDFYWQFDRGCVWLNSIILLDDRDAEALVGLHFLHEWYATGTQDVPIVCDAGGSRWEDHRP